MVPSSCRIEPEIVSTFDNKTYAYKINDCEHVLMMDGSKTYPIAVLAKTTNGEKKTITVIAGETIAEFVPRHGSLDVFISRGSNTVRQLIYPGQIIQEKDALGVVLLEIRRYHDGVHHLYSPKQGLQVLTNGKSIEIISPQILRDRSVGLCGDLNGEVVADVASPKRCVMTPKNAAMSYMLNKEGRSSIPELRCSGIPSLDLPKYKKEEQLCAKETIVPTHIAAIFESSQSILGSTGGRSGVNQMHESGFDMEQVHQGHSSVRSSRYSAKKSSGSASSSV